MKNNGSNEIPVTDYDGNVVGMQIRQPGRHPSFQPPGVEVRNNPYVARLTEKGMIIACEGPTDAIAVLGTAGLEAWSVVGCWSATTIPDRDWWIRRFPNRFSSVVACGDNDPSGKSFNQRIANLLGSAYELRWPVGLPAKWDVKDHITEYGNEAFERLVRRSIVRGPLDGQEAKSKQIHNGERTEHPGLIARLAEEAGGRMVYRMHSGGEKWLCPFHADTSDPSFTLDDRTGSWMCWAGCGQGGVLQFLMCWKDLSYKEAAAYIQKYR